MSDTCEKVFNVQLFCLQLESNIPSSPLLCVEGTEFLELMPRDSEKQHVVRRLRFLKGSLVSSRTLEPSPIVMPKICSDNSKLNNKSRAKSE
jgi:hypothetical protein